MKILQIINDLSIGGAEKLLLETIPLYNKRGISMDILVLNGTEYPFMKALQAEKCCSIFSYPNPYNPLHIFGSRNLYNPLHIFSIIKFLKEYDIVHAHLFPTQYWVMIAKLISFSSVKTVFTEHNTSNKRMENRLIGLFDVFIYKNYDKIVTISEDVDIAIKQHARLPDNRFALIKNGVNLSKINLEVPYLKNELGLPISEDNILLIQVSRFHPQKDQATLIKSLKLLPENVQLLLVGEGELRNFCENLVDSLGLKNRVHFLGDRMDVPKLLKTADIVVLSTHFEGLSLSSIEGLASGKPFVASNAPGLAEIVQGAGVLFPIQDEHALAAEINKLIDDKAHYDITATQCLERAKEYDIEIMLDKHLELYRSILA